MNVNVFIPTTTTGVEQLESQERLKWSMYVDIYLANLTRFGRGPPKIECGKLPWSSHPTMPQVQIKAKISLPRSHERFSEFAE